MQKSVRRKYLDGVEVKRQGGTGMSGDREVRSVRVQIFGEEHIIKGQASQEYIENLASLVDRRLDEVQRMNPLLPRHRVAILVAINLANELEKLKTEHADLVALLEEAN